MRITLKTTIASGFSMMLLLVNSSSNAINLEGVWEEDYGIELKSDENSKIDCDKSQKVVFEGDKIYVWRSASECRIDKKNVNLEPFIFVYKYEVFGQTKDTLGLIITSEITSEPKITTYHFTGDDQFWEYFYGAKNSDKYHSRVYFRKLSDDEANAAMEEFKSVEEYFIPK